MRKIGLFFLFAAAAVGLVAATGHREITVAAGEVRHTAVNAFNARVTVRGRIDESIFLLGGRLRLEGEATGDVICIAADVEIGGKAEIGRDLIVIGGRLHRAETSHINGRIYDVHSRRDLKQIAASVLPFIPDSGGMTFFRVIKIFFWLILSLLTLAVFPAPTVQAAAMLPHQPLRHAVRGLAAFLIFLLLILVFLLLSFVLIGIPLLIVLLAAYVLLLIFGRAVVFYFIGERLTGALNVRTGSALLIVLGVGIYALLKFIPYIGWLILFIVDLFAIGVATGYFLRRRNTTA